ncbi:hypothetical protein ACFYV7_06360 [Nocardia suismassiliense]|uniref:Uncharacterized protein n=1 Tax=Nocardia suismassiliense TaxID=2077092 RepID=A0ABW6QMG6_9NOCA
MRNLAIRALPGLGALLAVTAFATPADAAPPANAQQAQDTCLEYLRQTIRAMPEGTYLEAHPDSQYGPGHALPTGTGSAFLPRPEYYSLSYRLPSDAPYTTLADAESAWQDLGWPPARKPPYPNGAIATQAYPADGYTLDTIVGVGPAGTAVTMSCFTTQTFPGGGPSPAPAPASLVQ